MTQKSISLCAVLAISEKNYFKINDSKKNAISENDEIKNLINDVIQKKKTPLNYSSQNYNQI